MFTAFSTALSALNAYSTAIDVVGNNLANLNTPGFKANAVSFYDLVSQNVGSGQGAQVGFGVGTPITLRQFSQGSIKVTSAALDIAIQGDGLLILRDIGTGATVYSRGGNLQVDKVGNLLTATGQRVQGWNESAGVLLTNGPIGDIVLPVGTLRPAIATQNFAFDMNLDASAAAGNTFSSSIEVFDSLGVSHIATVTMTKSILPNEWNYSLTFPNADVAVPIPPVTGLITFDTQGKLATPLATAPPIVLPITGLNSGAANLNLTWNLYNGATPRITQYAQPSAISANQQDGAAAAQLVRVAIGDGGTVRGFYSSGQELIIGQIAMASIRNPESLQSIGQNNFSLSTRSALPAVGLPGTGGRGTIQGGVIEGSTVDIAREFTNLIVLQRGYQANTRVVTTADELSQDTINLKR
jgi:flagellar hook protein FlgE